MSQTIEPFCPTCGAVRPVDNTSTWCVPCLNRGHTYRLCQSVEDARRRVAIWKKYYRQHAFTKKEIAGIPHFQRLLKVVNHARKKTDRSLH